MKQGTIKPNGVVLDVNENATVVFLTELGFDIVLIPPLQRKGAHTPDIIMSGMEWEIKCPIGKSSNTIKRAFKTALRQSKCMIFDIRHIKMPDEVSIAKLKKEFSDIKSVKKLMIITKKRQVIDLEK